jgi:putative ABC transport system permease protein
VVAVLTLTLGIGANTAIFSVIEGVLLRPLPYSNPHQLVVMSGANQERNVHGILVSFTKLTRVQERTRLFRSVGGFFAGTSSLATTGVPEQVNSVHATGNLLDILGVHVAQGRGFLPQEDQRGGADVAVLSNGFWHSHFGGNPQMIGQAVSLDGRSVTIVGVLPSTFRFPLLDPEPDVWFPRVFEYPALDEARINSGAGYLTLIGRLQTGETMARAQAELDAINDTYRRDFPGFADSAKWSLETTSLQESLVGTLQSSLLALLAAVGLVLLIGCANVASLLLARTTARGKEIAMRRALGASQGRLMRQLLTESVVLSLAGGVLGVMLAWEELPLLRLLPAGTIPRLEEVRVDLGVLMFTLVLCLATGIAFGLLPALQAAQKDLHNTLKEGSRGTTPGGRGGRMRAALVVGEVALAVMLLTGTGLLIRSFTKLLLVNPGFDAGNVVTFSLDLPPTRYPERAQQAEFYRQLVERVKNLPGVQSAAAVSNLPLFGQRRFVYFCPEGTVCQGLGKDPVIAVRQITPDYFKTMRTFVLRGRVFTESDTAEAHRVVIINDTVASHFFPNEDPIGKHLVDSREMIPMEIVGVVSAVKFNSLSLPNVEEMYLPEAQVPRASMSIVLRTTSSLEPLTAALRRELAALDPNIPSSKVSRMEEVVSTSVAQPRLTTQCAGIFAALAVGLALVGIYGVMAYAVAQRIPEIGLRLALGAQPRDVLALVLGQGMKLVTAGVVVGTAGSLGVTQLLASLLFDTNTRDPLTFAGVAALLLGVALLACYVPARRAMRVDPMIALRYE